MLLLFALPMAAFGAERFTLLYLGPRAISPDENSGLVHQFRIKDAETGRAESIALIEVASDSERAVGNDALSAIDLLCRHQLKGTAQPADADSRERLVLSILALIARETGGTPLIGRARTEYLSKLESKTSKQVTDEIASELPDYVARSSGNTWSISFSVLTGLGAVEKHSYSGEANPLRVRQKTIEVMVPVGELPKIELLLLSE